MRRLYAEPMHFGLHGAKRRRRLQAARQEQSFYGDCELGARLAVGVEIVGDEYPDGRQHFVRFLLAKEGSA